MKQISIICTMSIVLFLTSCIGKNTNEGKSQERTYSEQTETTGDSYAQQDTYRSAVTFRHESDVHQYLQENEFVGEEKGVKITIYERHDMSLNANGSVITNPIRVTEFNETQAVISASSPYSGNMDFIVDADAGYLYYIQAKQFFYRQ